MPFIGEIIPFAGPGAPDGAQVGLSAYLACDGSSLWSGAYPNLYAAIGTAWGPGDAPDHFNLPDLRGRSLIGATASLPAGTYAGAMESKHGHPLGDGAYACAQIAGGALRMREVPASSGWTATDARAVPPFLGGPVVDQRGIALAGVTGHAAVSVLHPVAAITYWIRAE